MAYPECKNSISYLIDQSATVEIVIREHLRPEVEFAAFDEVTSLLFEHGILIRDSNQLFVAETFCIGNVCEIWVASLAESTNNKRIVELQKVNK